MFAKRFFFVCAGLLCLALAYHFGATLAGAQTTPVVRDVAVLTGEIVDGEIIPLPHYSDGTEALESECRWTVSIRRVTNLTGHTEGEECLTEGRVVRASWCAGFQPEGCATRRPATANYMIVAVRHDVTTSAQQSTWGRVKARYR